MDKSVITPDMRASARDYLVRRLANELSYSNALNEALYSAVERI